MSDNERREAWRKSVDESAAFIIGVGILFAIACAIAVPIMVWIDHVWP